MIPPSLDSPIPSTLQGDTLVLEGSLLGLLLEQTPPQAWDAETGAPIPVTWTEEVTRAWHADPPAVGGEVQTRVTLTLSGAVAGRRYRVRVPTSLHDAAEATLTAT